jgi:hypothetical protein
MLANIEQRGKVDLRNYKDIIVAAVQEFAPGSTVVVKKDHYTVKEQLSHSQVVRVGRRICESELGKYCISIKQSKLFNSTIIQEAKDENRNKQK